MLVDDHLVRLVRGRERMAVVKRRVRLVDIDRLIDERFMPKRCMQRGRSRCQCEHPSISHGKDPAWSRAYGYTRLHIGACRVRGCACQAFRPYDYAPHYAKLREKLRAFAFDVLRLDAE